MKISVVQETAKGEKRVLMLPNEVRELVELGHQVSVEKNAAYEMHIFDRDYELAGAEVVEDRRKLFGESDIVAKIKAPSTQEFGLLNGNILFSMFHHAQNPKHTYLLGQRGATAVELESIFNDAGERLIDATDITGEMGVLYATRHLQKTPDETSALMLGYGRVGSGAINMAAQLGMKTKILRREEFKYIEHFLKGKDLLINALSWPKEARDAKRYLVTREMLHLMAPGGTVLDLSVDYPNPIQTCRPTDLGNPFYIEEGRTHISIYGYPGLVPLSSSKRYSEQALPLLREIAKNGGLEGLAARSKLGKFISKAVVNPELENWRELKPSRELVDSLTE